MREPAERAWTDDVRLFEAAQYPEFASALAEHPNAYPALREWARAESPITPVAPRRRPRWLLPVIIAATLSLIVAVAVPITIASIPPSETSFAQTEVGADGFTLRLTGVTITASANVAPLGTP